MYMYMYKLHVYCGLYIPVSVVEVPDCCGVQQQDEAVTRVVKLHCFLESCQFREVWGEEGGVGEVTEHIADFQGQIRQCEPLTP